MSNGLTRKEKQCLYNAIKRVADRREDFSCVAISRSGARIDGVDGYALRKKYAEFYRKHHAYNWGELKLRSWTSDGRNWRLTLLAWFAEVGPRGVEK